MQSLGVLLTTSRGQRVMRRHIGTSIPRMIDAPMTPITMIDFYAGVAEALDLEPRFQATRLGVESVAADGHLRLSIQGVYFPRGHLGDFSVREPKEAVVTL